ncbi:hypothetical protein J3458_001517 [Metarhizium acridum]|uniref:uncharacterized protein n=1 Tax=Metarhizium acridum TaxID=92637 RepID=UPI001C6B37ED|nr:hypothetical protein J3458_001517 [Metarhizium acridum]
MNLFTYTFVNYATAPTPVNSTTFPWSERVNLATYLGRLGSFLTAILGFSASLNPRCLRDNESSRFPFRYSVFYRHLLTTLLEKCSYTGTTQPNYPPLPKRRINGKLFFGKNVFG